ncbi:MAG TPA: arsenite S-adenosylmethyltransferase, partial [Aminivibrio sp.]|nr:arsenite S-adenosylmethyltransferase [Aminivibrio sp.]
MDDIRNYVKERYARAIKNNSSCCGSGGCCCGTAGSSDLLSMTRGNYDGTVLEKTPGQTADQSFGCGNPFTEARI